MRIFDQHASNVGFDAANHPRRISQQHDVAAVALHSKVFINRTHNNAIGLRHHGIKRVIWDRSAAGDGRQPRPAPRPQLAVHSVPVQICAIASAPRGDALGQHLKNRIEGCPR